MAQELFVAGGRASAGRPQTNISPSTARCWKPGRVSRAFDPKRADADSSPDDPGNPTVNFRGEKRSNQTHESKTDPLLARELGGKSQVELQRNVLVENRNGLIVAAEVFQANGTAEREMLALMERLSRHTTADGRPQQRVRHVRFVEECRNIQRDHPEAWDSSAIDAPRILVTPSVKRRGNGSKNASAGLRRPR